MKIAVIGATGGTGRQVVTQALDQGHTVTAFSRHPESLDLKHNNLTLVAGSARESTDLEKAIEDSEAVICTIGAPARDKTKIRTEGTTNLIKAMEQYGPKRLIVLSSLGFGDSTALLGLFEKYFVVPLYLATPFEDHATQEAAVEASALDYTIVRPGRLTDGPHTGSCQSGFRFNDSSFKVKAMARADVADFMLKQLTDSSYVRKTVGICGT